MQQGSALHAIQCLDAKVSSLDTPSTDTSKNMQQNNVSLQRKHAEMLDLFQRGLAHQLLCQQPNKSDADLAKLPHCQGRLVALRAIHNSNARVSGLGAPNIIRSKSMRPTQCNKHSLQRRRLTHFQMVLPWQAALMVNRDVQISNSSMSFERKEKKNHTVRRHNGSLFTQRQPKAVALRQQLKGE